jgi:hypothetical protein
MSRLQRGVAAVALMAPVLVTALPAHAAVITADEILGQFNAVVTNNFSTNSDVEGRLVAGNINNSGSSTFYEGPNPLSAPSSFKGVNALTIPELPELQCEQRRRGQFHHQQLWHIQFEWRGVGRPKQPGLRDQRLHDTA